MVGVITELNHKKNGIIFMKLVADKPYKSKDLDGLIAHLRGVVEPYNLDFFITNANFEVMELDELKEFLEEIVSRLEIIKARKGNDSNNN